jgi:hypothetical protein
LLAQSVYSGVLDLPVPLLLLLLLVLHGAAVQHRSRPASAARLPLLLLRLRHSPQVPTSVKALQAVVFVQQHSIVVVQ